MDIRSESSTSKTDVLGFLLFILKWKKFIAAWVIVFTIIATGVAFVLPRWYKSTATILSPKDQSLLGALGGAGSLLKGINLPQRLTGARDNLGAYNYLAILKSRSVMEDVVRKYDLMREYGIRNNSMEDAVKELRNNSAFELQEDDYISIDVLDQDARRAADVANYFVELLNTVSIDLATKEARENRIFIEQRLQQVRKDLSSAEEELKTEQERTGMMISPTENSTSLAGIGELYGMKAMKEIQLGILERTVTKDNPGLRQLRIELDEVNKKIANIPEVGMGAVRLYRNVMIQQKILEYVLPMYEQAKFDEQKDVPVILVLDRAAPAERPDKPSRKLIVFVGMIVGFLLSMIVVWTREYMSLLRTENPASWEELQRVKSMMWTRKS